MIVPVLAYVLRKLFECRNERNVNKVLNLNHLSVVLKFSHQKHSKVKDKEQFVIIH